MLRKRATLLAAALLAATQAAAQSEFNRRFEGTILDERDNPVVGAKVVASSPDQSTYKGSAESNDEGVFRLLVAARHAKRIHLRIEADGFAPVEDEFALPFGRKSTKSYTMVSEATLTRIEEAKAGAEASELHDEGVTAAQAGNWKTAAEKFEAALAIDDALTASHVNLATAAYNLEDYARAEKHARRAKELGSDLADLDSLLAESLARQGKTDEAAALDPVLRAEMAYNRGAEEFNAGDHDEAYASFLEACEANPKLTDAHYQAGRVAFALGKLDQAREHLARYVELDPEGSNVATAKQLLAAIP